MVAHRDAGQVQLVVLQPGGEQLGQPVHAVRVDDVGGPAHRRGQPQPLGVVVAVGDQQRALGAQVEPVQPHRRDVGDHRVAVRHDGEDVGVGQGEVPGRPVAGGGAPHQPDDPAVRRPDPAVVTVRDPGVRLVDQAYVGHGQHARHDLRPDGVDRGVVVVVRVALPGRGVEDGAPRARRQHRLAVQVELRAPDPHEVVEVELEQPGRVPLDGRLTGDEDPVVGLGVVAGHALLVALAMVDVGVQHPGLEE